MSDNAQPTALEQSIQRLRSHFYWRDMVDPIANSGEARNLQTVLSALSDLLARAERAEAQVERLRVALEMIAEIQQLDTDQEPGGIARAALKDAT